MRLINVETQQLEEYFGDKVPKYAILSHCWGDDEVSFQDFNKPGWKLKAGSLKIGYTMKQAREDGLQYVWVDTCCIDKSSSAELSEAINSMYQWHEKSSVCYAYLDDVTADLNCGTGEREFRKSRWFMRGWTLQELTAPRKPSHIDFFGRKWIPLGTNYDHCALISYITHIPLTYWKRSFSLENYSIANKMTWAAKRTTTRVEDTAYCLLGIFGIHMPLLYGEGENAFQRLQKEIIANSDDLSILVWETSHERDYRLLASNPACFGVQPVRVVPILDTILDTPDTMPHLMTNRGLRVQLPMYHFQTGEWALMLNCYATPDLSGRVILSLLQKGAGDLCDWDDKPSYYQTQSDIFYVIRMDNILGEVAPATLPHDFITKSVIKTIYLANGIDKLDRAYRMHCQIEMKGGVQRDFYLDDVTPYMPSGYQSFEDEIYTVDMGDGISLHGTTLKTSRLEAAFKYNIIGDSGVESFIVLVTIHHHTEDGYSSFALLYSNTHSMPLRLWFECYKAGETNKDTSSNCVVHVKAASKIVVAKTEMKVVFGQWLCAVNLDYKYENEAVSNRTTTVGHSLSNFVYPPQNF